jgi:tetratricopeptide (TPR) repeat protein
MTQTFTAAPVAQTIIGYFEGIVDDHAHGWAYQPSHSSNRLTVQIVCNGEVVGYGIADQYREDLSPAGIGDGRHLFRIALSYELYDGQIHSLSAREAKTGTLLSGGSYSFGPENRTYPFDLMSRAQGLQILQEQFTQRAFIAFAQKANNFAQAYRLASTLQESGQLQEAFDAWTAIAKALGDNALCHCKLGENHLLRGQTELALEAFRSAAAADLLQVRAHWGIASAQRLLGQFVEAEEALQVALALQPHNTTLQTRLAEIQDLSLPVRIDALLTAGERETAIELLKKRLLADPENSIAADKLDELIHPRPYHDGTLPGLEQLRAFQKNQRLLDLLLDDAELILEKRTGQ